MVEQVLSDESAAMPISVRRAGFEGVLSLIDTCFTAKQSQKLNVTKEGDVD